MRKNINSFFSFSHFQIPYKNALKTYYQKGSKTAKISKKLQKVEKILCKKTPSTLAKTKNNFSLFLIFTDLDIPCKK